MFPYNLLILPLTGGYFFIANFAFLKYKYQRLDTPRLLLNSILAGILITIIAFALRTFVENEYPAFYFRCCRILRLLPIERTEANRYLGTLLFSLVGIVLFTVIINGLVKLFWGDELEQLFRDSVLKAQLIQLTLKNDKVYLGIIDKIPEPKKTNYVSLIPIYSGYRNKDTKEMTITTSYETINLLIKEKALIPKLSKMLVIIKQDEILIAQPHDPEIYASFKNAQKASQQQQQINFSVPPTCFAQQSTVHKVQS